jgi:RNA polymerase sigma-70 factor (ECF subfamily)
MALGTQFAPVLTAAKTGGEWAIAVLYREFQPRLLRYRSAQEPREGEDLAAETWLDAAAGLARFRGDEQGFQRWLFTIAHRRLIDLRRRRGRSPRASAALSEFGERPGPDDTEALALAATETEVALAHIATLPPDQAEVILLRIVAGLDVSDVAEIVGKKPGAVRVLQHRALTRLAERLTREGRPVTQ